MISILLATTGRPEKVGAFLHDLIATTPGHELEVVVAVDCCARTARLLESFQAPDRVRIITDSCEVYRGSSNAWNDALGFSTGDPVVLAADDLEWQPGWLDAALQQLAQFPDGWGFVGFNDGHWGPELSTHYLMSRRFVIEVLDGVVAWEAYRHSFNDREANERARRAGRYAWCEQARVLHRHWIFGDRPQDATDTRLLNQHPESAQAYEQRAATGFPSERTPVIA